MSNPALLHLPLRSGLDGRDRNGVVSATASGPVRFTADGYFAEEGTTNLVGNPTFATNATGWTGATRDTGYAYMGPASGLISATGANAEATYSLTVPASQHTLSAVIKNNAAVSRSFQLRYNGANVGSAVVVAAGAETRISGQFTGTGGAAAAGVRITDSANGETFGIGHMQIEAKAYATSPCPEMDASGAITTGYSWASTAHASASTRQASYLTLSPNPSGISGVRGCLAVRHSTYAAVGNRIWSIGTRSGGDDHLDLTHDNPSRYALRTSSPTDTTLALVTFPAALPTNTVLADYLDWDGVAVRGGLLGGSLTSGSRAAPTGAVYGVPMGIGTYGGGAMLNGSIRDLLIFDRPLTDAERATLAATPEWSFGVLQPKIGGLLRLGMGLGLAVSSVAAVDPVAILRSGLGGSD